MKNEEGGPKTARGPHTGPAERIATAGRSRTGEALGRSHKKRVQLRALIATMTFPVKH